MTKIGKITTTYQQLRFAHGVQLAVLDVLYKKKKGHNACAESESECSDVCAESDSESDEEIDVVDDTSDNKFIETDQEGDNEEEEEEEEEEDDDEDEVLVISADFKTVIDKVRKIVKSFNRSPLKNEILQKYVKPDHEKELSLLLDNKTRWSNLISMLERFYTIRTCIKKALVDIDTNVSIEDDEIELISDMVNSLKPIQAAVEALCRRDANSITADAVLNFTLGKLQQLNTDISLKLFDALKKRTLERRTELSGLIQYLHTGSFASTDSNNDDSDTDSSETHSFDDIFNIPARKRIESKICDLVERLNSRVESKESQDKNPNATTSNENQPKAKRKKRKMSEIHNQLDESIKKALSTTYVEKSQSRKDLMKSIKQETSLLENGGIRGSNLSMVYVYLSLIKPTSVECERAFSASGYFCSKYRTRLRDNSLDN